VYDAISYLGNSLPGRLVSWKTYAGYGEGSYGLSLTSKRLFRVIRRRRFTERVPRRNERDVECPNAYRNGNITLPYGRNVRLFDSFFIARCFGNYRPPITGAPYEIVLRKRHRRRARAHFLSRTSARVPKEAPIFRVRAGTPKTGCRMREYECRAIY